MTKTNYIYNNSELGELQVKCYNRIYFSNLMWEKEIHYGE